MMLASESHCIFFEWPATRFVTLCETLRSRYTP